MNIGYLLSFATSCGKLNELKLNNKLNVDGNPCTMLNTFHFCHVSSVFYLESEVFDFDARCKRWKDLGYCEADAHSLYMARSCRFSCPELAKEYGNSKV